MKPTTRFILTVAIASLPLLAATPASADHLFPDSMRTILLDGTAEVAPLPICRTVAEATHGTLTSADSAANRGSAVTFYATDDCTGNSETVPAETFDASLVGGVGAKSFRVAL